MMENGPWWSLYFDGGCSGNPGPMAIGFVLYSPKGEKVAERSELTGIGTNNIAEYRALLEGMLQAKAHGARYLRVFGDSELVIRQVTGRYRVKSRKLLLYYRRIKELEGAFAEVRYLHLPRERTSVADSLVKKALARSAHGRKSS